MYASNPLRSIYPAPKQQNNPEFETTYASEFCEVTDPLIFRRSQTFEHRATQAALRAKVASDESAEEFDPYRTTSSAYNGGAPMTLASTICSKRQNRFLTTDVREQLAQLEAQARRAEAVPRAEFAPSHAYGIEQGSDAYSSTSLTQDSKHIPDGVRDNVWAETHAMGRLGINRTQGYDIYRREHLATKADLEAQRVRDIEDAQRARYRVYKRSFGVY